MPFGPFKAYRKAKKDFNDCLQKMKAKYPDPNVAKQVCGRMQKELGG